MADALIGYTGFVGNNLASQHDFAACYNSTNSAAIAGRHYNLLVCSAAPAEKWKANKDPEHDIATIKGLADRLVSATAEQLILISTVDVYPTPIGVTEASPIDPSLCGPYGLHRHWLEQFVKQHFTTLIVRLPGLFGSGIKKNIVYDFLNNNQVENIHADSIYQFYNLDRLWTDIGTALEHRLELINFATQPVRVHEVVSAAFGFSFDNRPGTPPARYDFRSEHAELFGGHDGYLYDRDTVLNELRDFVVRYRSEPALR